MKKIYYLEKHEVKLGDIIECNGVKTLVTEKLIELNPELFKVEENIQPIYFKSLKGVKPFTTGRVYKQVDSIGSPTTIKLIADDNEEWVIYNWQSVSINGSSSCFELTTKEEWDKQELLDEAKRRYPVGTVYKHLNSEYTPEINFLVAAKSDYHFDSAGYFQNAIWGGGLDNYYGVVYHGGEWAEILPLKFTTEDGVDIYGDMKTYLVNPNANDSDITSCHGIWAGNSKAKCDKYFYHKENALAYIEKHKEKTLENYENMLLTINIDSINAREVCWFYRTLKGKEPKLYYTKILQLIADDLNDGWIADFTNNDEKWCISIKDIVHYMNLQIHGIVYFKECEFAEKARALLGDKINYLFN